MRPENDIKTNRPIGLLSLARNLTLKSTLKALVYKGATFEARGAEESQRASQKHGSEVEHRHWTSLGPFAQETTGGVLK